MKQAFWKHLWILLFSIGFLTIGYFIDAGPLRVAGFSGVLVFFYHIYKDVREQGKSDGSEKLD